MPQNKKNDPLGIVVVEHVRLDDPPRVATLAGRVVKGPDTSEGRMLEVAVAISNPKDQFIRRVGSRIARARLNKPLFTEDMQEVRRELPGMTDSLPHDCTPVQFDIHCIKFYLDRWFREQDLSPLLTRVSQHYHINKQPAREPQEGMI